MSESTLFTLFWTQIWQVTAVAVLVWALVKTAAQNRPHLAHALWLLVLLKALTPPLVASPTSPFCWIGASDRSVALVDATAHLPSATPASSGVTREITISGFVNDRPFQTAPLTTSTAEVWKRLQRWLFAIWVAGALFAGVRLMWRYAFFLRWISGANETRVTQIERLLGRLSTQIGTKQAVRVRVLDIPVGPAVLGIFRQTILLPEAIVRNRTDDQLAPLLAHELVHLRRGDLWWAVIQSLARCLLWFHPLVHLAARQLTNEAERSCDEETITSLGCSPATYARCLLNVLELKHQLRVAPALPGVRPVDVTSARLERVMKLGKGCHRKSPAWVWLVLILGCAAVLPGATYVLAQDPVKPVAKEPATTAASTKPTDDQLAHVMRIRVIEIDAKSVDLLNVTWNEQAKLDVLENNTDPKAASHITTKINNLPVKTVVLNAQELQRLADTLETMPDTKQHLSPTQTTQGGRPAEILSGKEIPFVTHYEKLEGQGTVNGEKKIAWQPKLELAVVGLQMQTTPLMKENGDLQIDVQFCHSALESAESVESEHDPSQKISRPVVVKNVGRSIVDAPKGGGLAMLIPDVFQGKSGLCIVHWDGSCPIDQLVDVDFDAVPMLNCEEILAFPGEKPDVRQFVVRRGFAVRKREPMAKADAAEDVLKDQTKSTDENSVTIRAVKGSRCSIELPAYVPEVLVNDATIVNLKPTGAAKIELELLKAGNTRIRLKQNDGETINIDLSVLDELTEPQLLPLIK